MTEFKIITIKDWETQVLSGEKPVLVDFQTPWCSAVELQQNSFLKLAQEAGDRVKLFQLDASQFLPIAMTYRLIDFPALALFKNGKIIKAFRGPDRAIEMKRVLDVYFIQTAGHF
jgi:thioredoxin 1